MTKNFGNPIGYGSTGIVYKGMHYRLPVAVKRYGALSHNNFLKEICNLSKCNHPNVINVLGLCQDKEFCLVMEFMSKGSLEDAVLKKRGSVELNKELILEIFIELCNALYYLHQHKIIHRDIRPGNVLFDRYGKPKFTDFDLSKSYDDLHSKFQASVFGSDLKYLDPMLFQRGLCGTFTDIYGIGLLLFVTFSGNKDTSVLHRYGRKIYDNKDFVKLKELFIHDWGNNTSMRLLNYMLACTDLNERNRPSADRLAENLEFELDLLRQNDTDEETSAVSVDEKKGGGVS